MFLGWLVGNEKIKLYSLYMIDENSFPPFPNRVSQVFCLEKTRFNTSGVPHRVRSAGLRGRSSKRGTLPWDWFSSVIGSKTHGASCRGKTRIGCSCVFFKDEMVQDHHRFFNFLPVLFVF